MMTVVEDDDSSWRWILKSMMANLKKNQNEINEQVKNSSTPILYINCLSSSNISTYINKLISHTPDLRINSNFAGVVHLIPFTCIPNKKKIHIVLLTSTYVNCLSPSNILLHE